jgi:hypothetical protein
VRARATILLTGLLLLAPVPLRGDGKQASPEPDWTAEQTERLVALAREYMEKTGIREKDEILARARELGPLSSRVLMDVVKELFKVARSGPKSDAKGTCTAKYPEFRGTYYLSGAGGGKKGIFVGLHGGGTGVGSGLSAKSLWGGASSKGLIGVFPTANLEGGETTWYSPKVEGFVLAIIKELKRTFRIDTNRIYVAGHSLGGSGSWHIGLRNADLFAGVSPNAGGLRGVDVGGGQVELPGGFVANLYNTPIFITHYDRDPRVAVYDARAAARELEKLREEHPKGYEHVYIEGEGVNHGFPPGGNPGKIINWLVRHKRDPYPPKVVWEPAYPKKRMFFWLRRASIPETMGRNQRLVATVEKNRVEIDGSVTRGLSVMLSDGMFDAKKPVTVVLNEKVVFEGTPPLDPAAALESILENIDPNQVFTYRIDL